MFHPVDCHLAGSRETKISLKRYWAEPQRLSRYKANPAFFIASLEIRLASYYLSIDDSSG
jgi:hypothetical protein